MPCEGRHTMCVEAAGGQWCSNLCMCIFPGLPVLHCYYPGNLARALLVDKTSTNAAITTTYLVQFFTGFPTSHSRKGEVIALSVNLALSGFHQIEDVRRIRLFYKLRLPTQAERAGQGYIL